MPKYTTRRKTKQLNDQQYKDLLEDRGVESISYYDNYSFSNDFTSEDYAVYEHIWSHGDKLYKLAQRYYGDKDMFWMIALYNKKPTDSHYKYGDIVEIPIDQARLYRDMVK